MDTVELYSTVTSWNGQYHNHANINKPWLIKATESELKETDRNIVGFFSYLNPEDRSEHLLYKRFNLEIADIVPCIISNVLNVIL